MYTITPKLSRLILTGLLLLTGPMILAQEVQWMTLEEATALAETEKNPKKIFVDVYTDWCGWCKKMDKDTFENAEVAAYMNENFYMVKLDGEFKKPINFKGKTFNFVPSGRRGYHELAMTLLNGRWSFPTVVFMDENLNLLSPVPGYHKPDPFLNIARYFGDNIYLRKDWKTYSGQGK